MWSKNNKSNQNKINQIKLCSYRLAKTYENILNLSAICSKLTATKPKVTLISSFSCIQSYILYKFHRSVSGIIFTSNFEHGLTWNNFWLKVTYVTLLNQFKKHQNTICELTWWLQFKKLITKLILTKKSYYTWRKVFIFFLCYLLSCLIAE